MKPRVLVIDDDEAILQSCETILEDAGYEVTLAPTAKAGLDLVAAAQFDLALVDLKLPDMLGTEVLRRATQQDPGLIAIMFTGYGTIETAVEAMRNGAFNYITKPFTSGQLLTSVSAGLQHSIRAARSADFPELQQCCPLHEIVGNSDALRAVLKTVSKVAPSQANVLVTGPSGTGKELIARALHANSPRRDRPFIPVDCAAIPASLMESELFGHEKGAFTGANQAKRGLLEAADGGTIFFDEIGEMPLDLQAKLLRVLQERTFRRIGNERLLSVDVRIIACTNRDLVAESAKGAFREDLLYRLNVVTILLPSLRERKGDVAVLAQHFVNNFAQTANRGRVQISADAMALLENYAWPGNVRELRNVLERAVVLCDHSVIRPSDIPECIAGKSDAASDPADHLAYKLARDQWVDAQSKQYLSALLHRHHGNVSAAAREAQISRKSFYELMHRLQIPTRSEDLSPVSSR